MTYGFDAFKSDGSLAFSSDSQSFTLYDSFNIPAQTNGSKSYPQLAGCSLEIQIANNPPVYSSGLGGDLPYDFSISYSLGYPVLTWTRNPAYLPGGAYYVPQTIYVMIKTAPTQINYGFVIYNNNNEILTSDFTSNYKFAGLATNISNTSIDAFVDSVAEYNITCNTWPLVFVENLENQMATVHSIYSTGTNTYRIRVAKNTNNIPRVFVFEKPSSISGYGIAIYDGASNLLFDTTSNVLNTLCYSNLTIPSTAQSSNARGYRLLSTNLLTTVGSLPAQSASCILATAFYGGEVNISGDRIIKFFYIGVKRSSNLIYSGWVCLNRLLQYPYDTYYPITSNTSFAPRIYSINIAQYI